MKNRASLEFDRWKLRLDKLELKKLLSECADSSSISDAFYRDLSFGTGGLRGKIGMGSNRMNVYTVGKASQGLSEYLTNAFQSPSVVICRDSRMGGWEFTRRAAEVFAANGVRVFLLPRPEPTPVLSYAVRYLSCSAGVNITASHNPAEYSGYKVYGNDGCQITANAASTIQEIIDSIDYFDGVLRLDFEKAVESNIIQLVEENVISSYVETTLSQSCDVALSSLSVAYTPLNGTGLECFSKVMKARKLGSLHVVEEQADLDGRFPTCPYPNPEVESALSLGKHLCVSTDSDLLIAMDPDADRVGVAIPTIEGCSTLSGNELGLLLLDFLVNRSKSRGQDLSRMVVMTTIVSAPMADDIARAMGFELRRTLTGFKYIGEQIGCLSDLGRANDFLFGFEESCGYLVGTNVRDKDGVVAAMLACELVAYWKLKGMTLVEALESLYERFGYWSSRQLSLIYEGPEGAELMGSIMGSLRTAAPSNLSGCEISRVIDYSQGVVMPVVNPAMGTADQYLPPANVLEFRLEDGSRVIVRPSGTEPKIKAYVFARAASRAEADSKLSALSNCLKDLL